MIKNENFSEDRSEVKKEFNSLDMFGKKKIEVNAIIDTEVENLLRQTSQYESLLEGKIKCKSCNTVITPENIGIMIPTNTDSKIILEFYCEKINCMEEYKHNG